MRVRTCRICGEPLKPRSTACGKCGSDVLRQEPEAATTEASAPTDEAISDQQELGPTQKAGFWRRCMAYWIIDVFLVGFVIFRLLFLGITAAVLNAAVEPDETWILGESRPGNASVTFVGCEPSVARPVCFFYFAQDDRDTAENIQKTLNAILVLTFFLYLWWGNATGQSIGKSSLRLQVVDKDTGQPLGVWRGLLRTLFYIPSALILFLGFLSVIWDKDKQAWHDKVARSVVVQA
jgi:uncharacterized RDD family membrane protein YckC